MATELGKAYVQIVPSAKGIRGAISNQLRGESERAGASAGSSIVSKIKGALAVAGIGKLIASSLMEGANLEQSIGGIETLFGDSAEKVKKYANEAYKTAGLSANAYMQNVTSFSASLLQSVGGDTDKAAEAANTAMIDMSDNANKMGTDMSSIQNAYQGFAKQNYTMLDNLKLGYGGTKTEMERLLSDAEKLTGVKYDINNLSDVYEAIHVVQDELGITGTTAQESAETFSGSMASMKGAFSNFMGNLALGNDIGPSLTALGETVSTFLFDNFIPMVVNILSALPGAVATFITTAAPQFAEQGITLLTSLANGIVTGIPILFEKLSELMMNVQTWITEQLPTLLQNGVDFIINLTTGMLSSIPDVISTISEILSSLLESIFIALPELMDAGFELIQGLATGLWNNLPAIIESATKLLSNLLRKIMEYGPDIIKKGFELIGKLAMGLWNNLPEIISSITRILTNLLREIAAHIPDLLQKGWDLIKELASGLLKGIPDVIKKVPEIVTTLVKEFGKLVGEFIQVGKDLLGGLAKGIGDAVGGVISKAKEVAGRVVNSVKSFFGINSPSRVFMGIGKYIDEGLAKGIADNIRPINRAMDDVQDATMRDFSNDVSLNIGSKVNKGINANLATSLHDPNSLKQTLLNIKLQLGNTEFKAFVDNITSQQEKDLELKLQY